MAKAGSEAAGGLIYGWWNLKRRLAGTERPGLTRSLSGLVAVLGALLIVEGIMVGWFFTELVPSGDELASIYARSPWFGSTGWAAGILLLLVGLSGVVAGALLRRGGGAGVYPALLLSLCLLGVGAVLLYAGARYGAGFMLAAGALDIVSGFAVSVILGLCWYTLDPLGLHGQPTAERAVGRSDPAEGRPGVPGAG